MHSDTSLTPSPRHNLPYPSVFTSSLTPDRTSLNNELGESSSGFVGEACAKVAVRDSTQQQYSTAKRNQQGPNMAAPTASRHGARKRERERERERERVMTMKVIGSGAQTNEPSRKSSEKASTHFSLDQAHVQHEPSQKPGEKQPAVVSRSGERPHTHSCFSETPNSTISVK